MTEAFTSYEGTTINSGEFSGLPCKVAARRIAEWMESHGIGVGKINYRLRDWLVSRQRYWGTPIPIIHCKECGEVPVPQEQLPVLLPPVENYKPNSDGRSPLASVVDFVNTKCPKCFGVAERETDTMAGSVDSSWYFLRFTSPQEQSEAWNRQAADYWMGVDTYIGGREHAVGHLLYARFFTKVFHDAGLIGVDEPFHTLKNQGMLLGLTAVEKETNHPIKPEELTRFGPDQIEYQWLKMSKSKGNSVTPDDMADKYGADALRLYVLFTAPFEDTIQWNEEAMNGTFRFLNRVWDVISEIAGAYQSDWFKRIGEATSPEERNLRRRTHQAIRKISEDIAAFRFNTAVSSLMIFSDVLRKFVQASGTNSPAAHEAAACFVKLLSPLAPHIADELWEKLKNNGRFLYHETWPVSDAAVAAEDEIILIVQVNGKLRDRVTLPAASDAKVCEMSALGSERVQAEIAGKEIKKIVVIPGKLVNIVVA